MITHLWKKFHRCLWEFGWSCQQCDQQPVLTRLRRLSLIKWFRRICFLKTYCMCWTKNLPQLVVAKDSKRIPIFVISYKCRLTSLVKIFWNFETFSMLYSMRKNWLNEMCLQNYCLLSYFSLLKSATEKSTSSMRRYEISLFFCFVYNLSYSIVVETFPPISRFLSHKYDFYISLSPISRFLNVTPSNPLILYCDKHVRIQASVYETLSVRY